MARLERILVLGLGLSIACSKHKQRELGQEWPSYGGATEAQRFTPLLAIDRESVGRLHLAWSAKLDTDRSLVGRSRRFEATPLAAAGRLYVTTPTNRVVALDPASGKVLWRFDPAIDTLARYTEGLTSRGLSFWRDSAAHDRCATRVIVATLDSRLIALAAVDGRPCANFGDHGVVVVTSARDRRADRLSGFVSITSPPTIVNDVIVVGSALNKTNARVPGGRVTGFDARSGRRLWSYSPGLDARQLDPQSAPVTSGVNVWSIITADAARDLVFLPTASAAPDHYGGGRRGTNAPANAVVAVRASTGVPVWSYQFVHHDLWDYDVAAPPVLASIIHNAEKVDVVVVGTKSGMIFVLDRENGHPIFPISERAVPQSEAWNEDASLTQPFASSGGILLPTSLTIDSLFGVTASDRAFCLSWFRQLRAEGIFTPPSTQGSLVWPGYWGGINWDGPAFDPTRHIFVTTLKRLGMVVRLHNRGDPAGLEWANRLGWEYREQAGEPYSASRMPFVAPSGTPCNRPPWGELVAIDLDSLRVRWRRPLGSTPWLRHIPESVTWGAIGFGAPLLTAGGVVFVAGAPDATLRAFDTETGELLWTGGLPADATSAPMAYAYGGIEYLAIVAGGQTLSPNASGNVVAFALRGTIE